MTDYLLLLLATLPPVLFIIFIYWMDRHQPESLKNILLAMLLGVFSIIPAIIVELAFGWVPIFTQPGITGSFFESFGLVAPAEEFFKFLVIYLFVRKKPFFDEINDGIVYFGAGAIGFALIENILYVFNEGFGVGIMRAFTSIPLHTFCGIVVGYHVGLSRFTHRDKRGWLILRGLALAVLTHALYNTLASSGNILVLLFVLLVLIVYIIGFSMLRRGRKLSLNNTITPETLAIGNEAPAVFMPLEQVVAPPVINFRTEDVKTDENGRPYLIAKKEIWKAVLGRLLFVITICFWILVLIGSQSEPGELKDLIFGTIILTIIPFLIGLLLEVSYQRRKHKKIYL